MTAGMLMAYAAALYAAAGLGVAVAFVTFGIGRVLASPSEQRTHPASIPFTFGARLLILPGAAALWPYVLARWLAAARGARRP
jgi:hypothetical protein